MQAAAKLLNSLRVNRPQLSPHTRRIAPKAPKPLNFQGIHVIIEGFFNPCRTIC
jgi:hypothetical protein